MRTYSNVLHHFFSTPSPNYGDQDLHSLTELLWYIYTELNPVDSKTVRYGFKQLEPFFSALPSTEANSLFCLICNICSAQERSAFIEGMRVGVMLMEELKAPD